jgi:multicomponent Na+:H+ antiporter subunit A
VLLCGAVLMMLAGWAAEAAILEAPPPMTALGRPAALFGLALLLGVFPFGLWAPPLGRAERPTAAFLGICALGLVVCLRLDDLALLMQPSLVATLMRWGGVATVVYGAIGAMLPRRLSAVVGYAAVADLGVAVLALSSDPAGAAELAVRHLAYRSLACATLWVASRVLAGCFGSDDLRLLGGAARRAPTTLAAVLLAGLSLAGLPPMAGFASRTAILATMDLTPGWALVWALGAIGPAWGLCRVVIASWGPAPPPGSRREPKSVALLLLGAGLALLILGVFPDLPAWLQSIL